MAPTANYPAQYESKLILKNGREIFIRPIRETDEQLIVDFFKKLSARSVTLRFLRHLDAIPQDMLYQFTHLNYSSEFALAGVITENGRDAIIAIARYAHTPHLPELAIAVRDDWQHLGLGKSLMKQVVEAGKANGIYRFGGMIDPRNKIIMKILLDLGYKVEYSLRSGVFEVEILVK
jgi:RimJ/RimL family protein N-acetyltransferase